MSEIQHESAAKSSFRGTFDFIADNIDEEKRPFSQKRCDCCYDPAVTRYYDPQLKAWFDVCESCKRFLEIQEQLNAVFNSLDEETREKIQEKLHKEREKPKP